MPKSGKGYGIHVYIKSGSGTAPVANCKEEQYSAHPKQDMTLTEYIDYWEDYRARGYPESDPCLYLKDWHFTM